MSDDRKRGAKAGGFLCSIIALAIPISMIVIGKKFYDDCPCQHFIPIYLVVGGSVGIVQLFLAMCESMCAGGDKKGACTNISHCLTAVVGAFCLGWFIAGNVWIYGARNRCDVSVNTTLPEFNKNETEYCHHTLYWYSFWITTATYILLGVGILFCVLMACCAGLGAICFKGRNSEKV